MQRRLAMRTLALLAFAAALMAQVGSRLATGYDSIQARRLKADLTFLSSDALEGRMSLQRGSEVAIQWIASQFAADDSSNVSSVSVPGVTSLMIAR